jgi:hypothetical protein
VHSLMQATPFCEDTSSAYDDTPSVAVHAAGCEALCAGLLGLVRLSSGGPGALHAAEGWDGFAQGVFVPKRTRSCTEPLGWIPTLWLASRLG